MELKLVLLELEIYNSCRTGFMLITFSGNSSLAEALFGSYRLYRISPVSKCEIEDLPH